MTMKKLNVSVVAFDYGNTLVFDTFGELLRLKANDFHGIMGGEGYKVSGKEIVNYWASSNDNMNPPHCSHFYQEISIVEDSLKKLNVSEKDRGRIAQQLLAAYRGSLESALRKDERIDDVKEVLSELKGRGKKLAVMTNDREEGAKTVLYWTGLDKYFEEILISEAIGIEKPDPEIFRYLIKVTGAGKDDIVYVGDDPERDIKPAKELGMKAILLKNPENLPASAWRNYEVELDGKHEPDFVIGDLRELLEIIY
ncbi:MAG: HAD family hydrolase [Candidatus Aenigmarchaeota archaeon]